MKVNQSFQINRSFTHRGRNNLRTPSTIRKNCITIISKRRTTKNINDNNLTRSTMLLNNATEPISTKSNNGIIMNKQTLDAVTMSRQDYNKSLKKPTTISCKFALKKVIQFKDSEPIIDTMKKSTSKYSINLKP